jgi:nitrogen regulatory protein P-II 1
MKIVIAYIQPELLASVKQALGQRGLSSMSVLDAQGCGLNDGPCNDPERAISNNNRKVKRIELGVADHDLDDVLEGFRQAARSARDGDLTVYVQEAAYAMSVRTSEDHVSGGREAVA